MSEAHGPLEATRDKTWIETYSTKQFWLLDPDGAAVDPIDVAHAIAYQCRYNGHTSNQALKKLRKNSHYPAYPERIDGCDDFLSVAEHCCHLADYCLAQGWGPQKAFQALIHDAGEAYSGDIPRPWKNAVPRLRDLEHELDMVVLPALGGAGEKPDWLDKIDTRILQDERTQARNPSSHDWKLDGYEPLGITIQFWNPERAKREWMRRYNELYLSR